MVKIGDRVRVVGYKGLCKGHDHYGTTGIVTRIYNNGNLDMKTDNGFLRCGRHEDFEVIPAEPPQKITQNGYEYELVDPVKPDWLVDGAWVVDKYSKEKYQVIGGDPGNYLLRRACSEPLDRDIKWIESFTRPHTASDWKWGDWAIYAGKRVFVVGSVDNTGRIFVSYPDIYPLGRNDADRNFLFIPSTKLTPTF